MALRPSKSHWFAPPVVRTSEIYWGAMPFVGIQVVMVALIIAFPGIVTVGLDRPAPISGSTPVQFLAPPEDQGGAGADSPPEDAADLFRQLPKPPPQ